MSSSLLHPINLEGERGGKEEGNFSIFKSSMLCLGLRVISR